MILQALTEYYETLAKLGEIAPRNYAKLGVSFGLWLTRDGRLGNVVTLKQPVEAGKKTVDRPQPLMVPEPVIRSSGVAANFLCDNSSYMLGIDGKGKPDRTLQCFEAAKELHLKALDGVPGEAAEAVRAFFESWEPSGVAEHPLLAPKLEELFKGANLVLIAPNGRYAFEDPAIRAAWERYRDETQSAELGQCLVTGQENQPIAATHPKIKGMQGAQSSGASLVSFNAPAYESYGKEQSFNAPVSEYAAFAYAAALNHLLADRKHRMIMDGDTVVCWAKNGDEAYQNMYLRFIDPRAKTDEEVAGALKKAVAGKPLDAEGLDLMTPFCILCLSPNAARLSVRFFYQDSFGNILSNVAAHFRRMEIEKAPREAPYVSLYWLLRATVFEQSKDDAASPLLAGAVLRSIISDTPYPAALYSNILMRIRAESKVDRTKAAVVQAYLMKNGTHRDKYKEVLHMPLNETSTIKPYVLGRLFALLEQAQESANPGVKATITDKYFDSACSTPRLAFPTLLKLSRHHIAKDDQWGWRSDRLIGEVTELLDAEDDPYPAHLTPEEQGLFILGYYHQRQARFRKKEDDKPADETQINKEEN